MTQNTEQNLQIGTPVLTPIKNLGAIQNAKNISDAKFEIATGNNIELLELLDTLDLSHIDTKNKKELSELYAIDMPSLNKIIKTFTKNRLIIEAIGKVPSNVYDYIELQLTAWKTTMNFQEMFTIKTPYEVRITFGSNKITTISENSEDWKILSNQEKIYVKNMDPKTLNFIEMLEKLKKQSIQLNLNYGQHQLLDALNDWKRTAKAVLKADIIRDVVYDKTKKGKSELEWDKFANAITDVNVQETKTVLKHFIWQTKRKMFDKKVTDHIMPVLYGAQGIGKSSVMQQLIAPIKEFSASTDFTAISDARSHSLWENYILVFDEMGGSTVANIENIKRCITEETKHSRVLGTNIDTMIINKSTFIGSSNRDLGRLIFDDTGMRRFFQVECKRRFDWKLTNSIDYNLLWVGINEDEFSELKDDPAVYASIKRLQESKRHKSLVEQFLEDELLNIRKETISGESLYKRFQEYELKHLPTNKQTNTAFAKELMDISTRFENFSIEKKRSKNGISYIIENETVCKF